MAAASLENTLPQHLMKSHTASTVCNHMLKQIPLCVDSAMMTHTMTNGLMFVEEKRIHCLISWKSQFGMCWQGRSLWRIQPTMLRGLRAQMKAIPLSPLLSGVLAHYQGAPSLTAAANAIQRPIKTSAVTTHMQASQSVHTFLSTAVNLLLPSSCDMHVLLHLSIE